MPKIIKVGQCFTELFKNNTAITLAQFLPRDASAERGDEIACRPSVRPYVRNVQVPCSNRFEFFENNFTAK